MKLLCRVGWHRWSIYFANIAGHQSYRDRRCLRCDKHQRQDRGYFGGARSKWYDRALSTTPEEPDAEKS